MANATSSTTVAVGTKTSSKRCFHLRPWAVYSGEKIWTKLTAKPSQTHLLLLETQTNTRSRTSNLFSTRSGLNVASRILCCGGRIIKTSFQNLPCWHESGFVPPPCTGDRIHATTNTKARYQQPTLTRTLSVE